MTQHEIIDWLLDGDVSIQYQVFRDLLNKERNDLKKRIETGGWGNKFLSLRGDSGHWGRGFYQPKWTSTHYTLLDLKNLGISKSCQPVKDTLDIIINEQKAADGGINPAKTVPNSDVCINGMALNYFCYFDWPEKELESMVDFILTQHMNDGGFNCESNQRGARHSSLHTTLSILEGILEYRNNGYSYRLHELTEAEKKSVEFILSHRLFKSDKTGEIIRKEFLKLTWPHRWRYDILRALDHFRAARLPYDVRIEDALMVLKKKRSKEGTWNLQSMHKGAIHFEMEKSGKPSRWITLLALRVLKHYG